MKALLTFLFIAFLSLGQSYSQSVDSLKIPKFRAFFNTGVKIGVNISSLDSYNNNSSRLGLMLGLTGEYRFSNLLGIATELHYSQHGTTLKHASNGGGGITFQEVEYGLNYLNMPVLLTLHDNNFTVQAGGYGGVLLKAKAQSGKITEDITEHFAQQETGLCLGLAYHFWGNTVLGMRFYRGLHNINKTLVNPQLHLRSSTLQITGGYTF